jgi:hypothetical protein
VQFLYDNPVVEPTGPLKFIAIDDLNENGQQEDNLYPS